MDAAVSRPARLLLLLITVVTVVLELVVYFVYRATVDGQAVFANAAVLVYALLAAAVVVLIDKAVRRVRSRRAASD